MSVPASKSSPKRPLLYFYRIYDLLTVDNMSVCLSVCLRLPGSTQTKNHFQNRFEGTTLDLIRKFRFSAILAHKKFTSRIAISGHIYAQHKQLMTHLGTSLQGILQYANNHSNSVLTQTYRLQTHYFTRTTLIMTHIRKQ
jgi:hypothetical protein